MLTKIKARFLQNKVSFALVTPFYIMIRLINQRKKHVCILFSLPMKFYNACNIFIGQYERSVLRCS